MGFWSWIKGAAKKVGSVVSKPLKKIGEVIGHHAGKLISDIGEGYKKGGIGGVLGTIANKAMQGAKLVSQIPGIQATPVGKAAMAISASEDLAKAVESGDVKQIVKAGVGVGEKIAESRVAARGGRGGR